MHSSCGEQEYEVQYLGGSRVNADNALINGGKGAGRSWQACREACRKTEGFSAGVGSTDHLVWRARAEAAGREILHTAEEANGGGAACARTEAGPLAAFVVVPRDG